MDFGGNTRDLGAHLEKKRTRLRLYAIYLEELCKQSMETMSRLLSDGQNVLLGIKCSKVFQLLEYISTVSISVLTADVYTAKKFATVEDFALLHEDKSTQSQRRYLQHKHYALWEVIEFGDSYKAPPEEIAKDKGLAGKVSSSTKKKGRTVAITAEDIYKKTKKNQLKQQYGNFKAKRLETLEQTFNRLQAIVSHLEFMDVPIEQDDLNQKFLTTLGPEWLVYTIVWRNKDDLDTISLDDVYNHFKVYKLEVQKKAGVRCSSVRSEDLEALSVRIDDDDIEEMDIKWNLALLSMRADRECRSPRSQDRGERESYKKDPKVEEPAPKEMIDIDGIGWDWSYMADEDETSKNHALMVDKEEVPTEYALMTKSSSSSDNETFRESKLDKDMKGVGLNEYCVVPPPPAQIYSPPKKDLSWMGLPEFIDDTVIDYTRPTPSIDVSKSVSKEQEERWKSNNPSFSEKGGSSGSVVSKRMIKFVKESGYPNATKVNNTENARKPTV
nr:hypothetical protein [Tanacetum cinerariifolium]